MGRAKEELNRREEGVSAARAILVKTGALGQCPVHEDIFYVMDDNDAEKHAYALATTMHQKGELDGTLQEVRKAIAEAIQDAGVDCPRCQKD